MSQTEPAGPDLSVVIVSWNVRQVLRACLHSIPAGLRQSDATIFGEIIVVDNNSMDGSVSMVAEDWPDVRLIANDANLGFARASNQGIRASHGRHVLLLNPDTRVLPGSLYHMVQFLDNHPDVGAVGCRIIHQDGQIDHLSALRLPSISNELLEKTGLAGRFPDSRLLGGYLWGFRDHGYSRLVETLSGACLMVRRAALAQIGLLDEWFFMYCEDADLCLRLSRAGWQIYYYADAQVLHVGRQSTQQQRDEMGIIALQSIAHFLAKHRGHIYATAYRLLMTTISVAKAAYSTIRLLLARQETERRYHSQKAALHARVIIGLWQDAHTLVPGEVQTSVAKTNPAERR